jgi:Calcium binding
MAKSKKINAKREHRIEMEVVVDAYNEEERAMSWYYYLEEHLAFPFEGRIREAMAASPLRSDETVSVTGLAHEDLCRVGIFVWVRWNQRDLVVPLAQIVPVTHDEPTQVAVADWHYWHDQGYAF